MKIGKLWNKLDKETKVFIGVFALYMLLYVVADVAEWLAYWIVEVLL